MSHYLVGSEPTLAQLAAWGMVLLADTRFGPAPHPGRNRCAIAQCACGCGAPVGEPCWYCEGQVA